MANSYKDKMSDDEIRLVLLGKTGSGKSATGNTILNKPQFKASPSGSSVTASCSRGETVRKDGRQVLVVDTPGLFDTNAVTQDIMREVCKCFGLTSPGPHAVLLIIGIGRFTQEEQDTVNHFMHFFGNDISRYMMVVFTREDSLQHDGMTIETFVETAPKKLRDILARCNNRYIALDNRASETEKRRKIDALISLVDNMVRENGGVCFTNETYQATEETLEKRMKEIRDLCKQEHLDEFTRDLDNLRDENEKLENKLQQMRKEKERAEEQKHLLQIEVANLNIDEGGRGIEIQHSSCIGDLEKRKVILDQEIQKKERQKQLAAGRPVDDRTVRTKVRNEIEKFETFNVLENIVKSIRRVGTNFLGKALNYFAKLF